MIIKPSPIFGVVALAIGLSSCQSGNKGSNINSDHDKDTTIYKITEFYQSSPYYQQREDGYDTSYYKVSYPVSDDSQFNALVMESLSVKDRAELEQSAEAFLADYDSYVEEANKPEFVHAWYQDIASRIILTTPRLLVVGNKLTEYSGGAHGNYAELFYNYDLQENKKLSINDVVATEKQQELIALAETRFREIEKLAPDAALTDKYFFDEGIFVLPDNFAFDRKGIVFQYNPYEIKPYADGVTRFEIPYEKVESLLTEKAKAFVAQIQNQ